MITEMNVISIECDCGRSDRVFYSASHDENENEESRDEALQEEGWEYVDVNEWRCSDCMANLRESKAIQRSKEG